MNDPIITLIQPRMVSGLVLPLILAIFLSLNGCTGKTTVIYIPHDEGTRPAAQLEDNEIITEALEEYYADWQGTRYIYGGLSRSGVDCSGFTLLAFKELFRQNLPRTVKGQVKEGIRIPRASLQAGDLVFFKTGLFQKHVGIYLEDDRFMHASRSKGVTISSLQNPYWQKRFWQAQRIQPEADLEMLSSGIRQQTVAADY